PEVHYEVGQTEPSGWTRASTVTVRRGPWRRKSPTRPESGSLRDEAIGDVEGPVERGVPEPEDVARRTQRRDDVNPVEVCKRKHTVGLERGDDLVHLR